MRRNSNAGASRIISRLAPRAEDLEPAQNPARCGKDKFTFESERMARFAELLGLPNAMSSYEYLQEGERDESKAGTICSH